MENKEYLGKIVNVEMDRKMGSAHPKHGFIYPVNYGFIPNTVSGDGEELDAYVIGVFEPLDQRRPELFIDKNYRDQIDLAGLHHCQDFR